MDALKDALQSERADKARLDMARENLEADVAALRANLQQLSRELAYHRSDPAEDPPLVPPASQEVWHVPT